MSAKRRELDPSHTKVPTDPNVAADHGEPFDMLVDPALHTDAADLHRDLLDVAALLDPKLRDLLGRRFRQGLLTPLS